MNRRQFLAGGMGGILLAAIAPAIVRADSLMRIVPRETTIIQPPSGMWRYEWVSPTGVEHCRGTDPNGDFVEWLRRLYEPRGGTFRIIESPIPGDSANAFKRKT